MKEIQKITPDLQVQGAHDLQGKIPDQVKQIVDKVFKQLETIYPGYRHQLPTQQAIDACKLEWTKAFYENGINTIDAIKRGFVMARKQETDFMPSCGKFVSWCKLTPEQAGWPSVEKALDMCIKYRSSRSFYPPPKKLPRPLILKLCSMVDWWMINNVTTKAQREKADRHFESRYLELFNSGYVEPEKLEVEQLPTPDFVNHHLSEKQSEDKKQRGMKHVEKLKSILKGGKND